MYYNIRAWHSPHFSPVLIFLSPASPPPPLPQLILDLSTGKADGLVTILPTNRCQEQASSGGGAGRGASTRSSKVTDSPPCDRVAVATAAAAAAGGETGEKRGDGGMLSLSIALPREWTARLIRPALPLRSLPSRVVCPRAAAWPATLGCDEGGMIGDGDYDSDEEVTSDT